MWSILGLPEQFLAVGVSSSGVPGIVFFSQIGALVGVRNDQILELKSFFCGLGLFRSSFSEGKFLVVWISGCRCEQYSWIRVLALISL